MAGCAILLFQRISPFPGEPGSAQGESIASVDSHRPLHEIGSPVRIRIPAINIDAAIEKVALTPDGTMDVPKGPADAAWFSPGPRPGEKGSAVIAGHYGWKNGVQAVFDNLYTLRKGEKIYIEDENGATAVFVVRESRAYGEHQDDSDVFGSLDGKAHLNLITCEGVWDAARKSYSDRLVVFADKAIE